MASIDRSLFGDEHVRRYEETNGEVGYMWNDAPIAILTTTGRVTGKERKHALIFGRDGDDVLLVASKGGAPDHPHWYENLAAEPKVKIQIKDDLYDGIARTASAEEKARLWPTMLEHWSHYDEYQERTDRDIPLVIVEPA